MDVYLPYIVRHLPELMGLAFAIWIQFHFAWWFTRSHVGRRWARLRLLAWIAAVGLSAWVAFGVVAHFPRGYRLLPHNALVYWGRGGALAWAFSSIGAYVVLLVWRRLPEFDPKRRRLLRTAGTAAATAPLAVIGFGMLIERSSFRIREQDIRVRGLHRDLHGLRIVQLSDIHLSPFLSEAELARAVDMANDTRAHLAVVTGDLITATGDPLDACLRQLARLRADAGVMGCLGNHEIYAHCEDRAQREGARLGLDFLRMRNRRLRFGKATLNVAGVDYQRPPKEAMLRGTERLLVPSATNLLLSHNPNSFDAAAAQGWDVVLAGHTHGGQVTVEILDQSLNAARFFTDYVYGLYTKGPHSIWVTRGIGTVGLPARVGAPPEIALLRLCAT